MGLAETQNLLARLYVDREVRQQFLSDPHHLGQAYGLTDAEVHALREVSREQISFYARSLVRKRMGEVRRILPLTAKTLGGEFPKLFTAHARRMNPSGIKKHAEDAIAFAGFLRLPEVSSSLQPNWASDLAHYEVGWLRPHMQGRCFEIRLFRFNLRSIIPNVRQGEDFDEPPRQTTLGLWFRPLSWARVVHVLIPVSIPSNVFVTGDLCHGTYPR